MTFLKRGVIRPEHPCGAPCFWWPRASEWERHLSSQHPAAVPCPAWWLPLVTHRLGTTPEVAMLPSPSRPFAKEYFTFAFACFSVFMLALKILRAEDWSGEDCRKFPPKELYQCAKVLLLWTYSSMVFKINLQIFVTIHSRCVSTFVCSRGGLHSLQGAGTCAKHILIFLFSFPSLLSAFLLSVSKSL